MRQIDLTGIRFGRLTVIGRSDRHRFPSGQTRWRWECVCDCGATSVALSSSLRGGTTASCGCLAREVQVARGMASGKAFVTYSGAHARVRRKRGNATGHGCVDCAGAATNWSYNHDDPDEVSYTLRRDGRTYLIPYSMKPEHYSPRCTGCHRVLDDTTALVRRQAS